MKFNKLYMETAREYLVRVENHTKDYVYNGGMYSKKDLVEFQEQLDLLRGQIDVMQNMLNNEDED
jgi:hypothetical protein